jgi:ATP-dependent DNA ligase
MRGLKSMARASLRQQSRGPTGARPTRAKNQLTFALPLDMPPMEARSTASLPATGGPWQFEPKWDGFRCLAFKAGNAVDLRAKSGKPLGRYFPEVVTLLQDVAVPQFVIDGELVIELDGKLAFDALQLRLHPAESRIRKLAAATPARLIIFDMLVDPSGAALIHKPLRQRRNALETFMREAAVPKRLVLSPATIDRDKAQRWLTDAPGRGTDGVIAKRLDEPYVPGERTILKVKRLRTADCVVGGFRYQSKRSQVGSLLLGLYDADGKLNHVGFTSTIADGERPGLTDRLEKLRRPPGFTGRAPGGPSRWSTERSGEWEPLRPELVVEVRFDHVSGGRFRHGTKLMRWRPDKAPEQCTFEQIAPAAADVS